MWRSNHDVSLENPCHTLQLQYGQSHASCGPAYTIGELVSVRHLLTVRDYAKGQMATIITARHEHQCAVLQGRI